MMMGHLKKRPYKVLIKMKKINKNLQTDKNYIDKPKMGELYKLYS